MTGLADRLASTAPLLWVEGLSRSFPDQAGGSIRAVDAVSLNVAPGEVLGVVGESGSGKTTLGRLIMRLIEPDSGQISFRGEDFLAKRGQALKQARRSMQMVFQDPFGSLNPRHRVGSIITEPLIVHGAGDVPERVLRLLELVGLPAEALARYPHEFSGGQRQRIAIARALALEPRLLIADEPVSALDVSIQSQILNLLAELQARLGLSMLFISHDLSVIRHVSNRIAVMYFGRIVESRPTEAVFARPAHPYTAALLAAIPRPPGAWGTPGPGGALRLVAGEVPDPADPPPGCAFAARCPLALARCTRERPPEVALAGSHDRRAACFIPKAPDADAWGL